MDRAPVHISAKLQFTRHGPWRVRERVERCVEGEPRAERSRRDDSEEDETPVVIPSSAVTVHPKGTPAPCSKREWT